MDPVIGGALIGTGVNLISGLLGSKSQSTANKTNLAIARETNAANERINQANIDYQKWALGSQQQYASYANQMAMAREAGINPYSALGVPAAGGSAGTPVSHAMQAAHVEPENAFASALGRSSQDAANMVTAISQANEAQEKTKGLAIDNKYKEANYTADLNLKGLQGAALDIQNEYNKHNNPLLLRAQEINNEYLSRQSELAQIESDIKRYYKDNIQPKELDEILERIQLLKEQGVTEITKQELNKVMGKAQLTQAAASMINASVNQYLAPSVKAMNESQVTLNEQLAEVNRQEASIKRSFGGKVADALLEQINSGNRITDATLTKIWTENRILQKEYDMSTFKSIIGALIPIGAISKVFGIGTTPLHISGFGK